MTSWNTFLISAIPFEVLHFPESIYWNSLLYCVDSSNRLINIHLRWLFLLLMCKAVVKSMKRQ